MGHVTRTGAGENVYEILDLKTIGMGSSGKAERAGKMTFKWILRRNLDHRRRLAVPWLRRLVRVRNRVSPRDICGGQSGIARGFSPIFRLSRVNIIPR